MDTSSPYFAADGQPRQRQSVVAFMDVLGFKEEIQEAHREGNSDELLRRFASVVKEPYKAFRETFEWIKDPKRSWEVKAFTDNVVIGYPILSRGDTEFELGEIVDEAGLFQLWLALEGFFVRGGIAIGELYLDEDMAFGAGLLDAHRAEEEADVPRIVLAESSVAHVEKHVRYYASPRIAPQDDALLIDEDGRHVVNYLDNIWPNRTEEPDLRSLAKHRDIVSAKLDEHRARPHVWAKYAWVARYHNFFCESFPAGSSYKVDASLPGLAAKMLHEVYPSP